MEGIMKESKTELVIVHLIKEALPHGSGIDGTWSYGFLQDKYYTFSNSFHCMNDNGYYDGWQNFTLKVEKKNIENFKLEFNGHRKEKYIWQLRDYLEDSFAYVLNECQKKIETLLETKNAVDLDKVVMYFQCKEEACQEKGGNKAFSIRTIIDAGIPHCQECQEQMEESEILNPRMI